MKKLILKTLQNSKQYTLAVAGAMPESSFNFKPVEGVWNFVELLHHIGYGICWWKDNFIAGKKSEWNAPPLTSTPEATKQYLEKAFDDLLKTIESVNLNEDVIHGFYTTIDHVTHHRGQAVTYLRASGITPPEYIY
jgi:uncharacterized damage-inducible protein DinB